MANTSKHDTLHAQAEMQSTVIHQAEQHCSAARVHPKSKRCEPKPRAVPLRCLLYKPALPHEDFAESLMAVTAQYQRRQDCLEDKNTYCALSCSSILAGTKTTPGPSPPQSHCARDQPAGKLRNCQVPSKLSVQGVRTCNRV